MKKISVQSENTRVIQIKSRKDIKTPDAVFPNNWFSAHRDDKKRTIMFYARCLLTFEWGSGHIILLKGIKKFLGVKILTERKRIKVKISPGRPSLKSVYKNKWEFKHRIQWELNKQALLEAAKTDGLFPLITNTALEACEVLKKYKNQPFLEKRMYTKKTVLKVASASAEQSLAS